ncbi:MAG: clan AA aspartic protease, partial [Candidatus Eremiobacteraeota bacterium]|nr:clan AA aspartic protease [Candidatus Eremiobacteraeota bacterium]
MNATVDGVYGSGTISVDRLRNRYVEQVEAGARDYSVWFDGKHAWSADDGHIAAGDRDSAGALAAFTPIFGGFPHPEKRRVVSTSRSGITYDVWPKLGGRKARVLVQRATGTIARLDVGYSSGPSRSVLRDYRKVRGVLLPFTVVTYDSGVVTERVTSVEIAQAPPPKFFKPRSFRSDVSLLGTTSLTMRYSFGRPVIGVKINGKGPFFFVLDTGSTNLLTRRVADRLKLALSGHANYVGTKWKYRDRYTAVRELVIGSAVLHDQPFEVVADPSLDDVDGVIGYEVLTRLAARVDFRGRQIVFARSARS